LQSSKNQPKVELLGTLIVLRGEGYVLARLGGAQSENRSATEDTIARPAHVSNRRDTAKWGEAFQ
jgi:hypothetical protein